MFALHRISCCHHSTMLGVRRISTKVLRLLHLRWPQYSFYTRTFDFLMLLFALLREISEKTFEC